jgi:hypothetical protein
MLNIAFESQSGAFNKQAELSQNTMGELADQLLFFINCWL